MNTLSNRLALSQNVLELDGTVLKFNKMMGRLQKGFMHEQQFSGDVAHELRTPLAEIKSLAQVAIKWPNDETVRRTFYRDVLDATEQMENTINNLLVLARSWSVVSKEDLEYVEVSSLINSAIRKYNNEIVRRGLSIQQNGTLCEIQTVLPYMNLVIENLINNATYHGKKINRVCGDPMY